MEVPFTLIRNKIRKYNTEDLLNFYCRRIDSKKDDIFPLLLQAVIPYIKTSNLIYIEHLCQI